MFFGYSRRLRAEIGDLRMIVFGVKTIDSRMITVVAGLTYFSNTVSPIKLTIAIRLLYFREHFPFV